MKRSEFLSLMAASALSALLPAAAQSQAFPTKPIRLIVPYAPGGATDIIGRAAAAELSKTLGQPVNVENRPGAGGNLGAEQVARSTPDGYTLLVSPSSLHGITPFLYNKLSYDPNKDLAPVIVLGSFANVLVVNPEVKANSVKELIALIKSQPGKYTYASSGNGSTIHMSGEMFRSMLNLEITHVPYKGSAPALTDLIGGQVNLMFDNIPSAINQIRAGKLRALATTGPTRSSSLSELPTMIESGLPGYVSTAWFGIAAPAGTPQPVIDRLAAAFQKSLSNPDTKARLAKVGFSTFYLPPKEFVAYLGEDEKRMSDLIKTANIKAE